MNGEAGRNARSTESARRVLITVPRLSLAGGVANYYRTLKPLLGADTVFFEVGSRPGAAGRWSEMRRLIADYWRFHRLLRQGRFDLVHLNPSLGSRSIVRDGVFLLLAKAHGRLVLVFFRGWDPACEAAIRARYTRLFRSVYGRADAVVVLAREFARRLRAFGIRVPITVETTVVEDCACAGPAAAGTTRSDGPDVCEILYLSRLDRGKGLPEAIETMARLVTNFPSVTFTVAGEGPERATAEAAARKRGWRWIRFRGHLDDEARSAAMARANVFFFPTFFGEGMPNVVLEAMASGLPVVTRAVGGLNDFFEDGRMGFITDSRDPAVFADLLGRLVADPALRASMGRYNREYARTHFAASVVASRLLGIYEQVRRQGKAH